MAHELKSRLAAIRKCWKLHHERRQVEAWLYAEQRSAYGAHAMYPVILFLAAVGVAASSLPAYSAGDSRGATRDPVVGGPSVEVGCLDVFSIDPDRREALRRRWRCAVNLTDDGTIDHRRPRR